MVDVYTSNDGKCIVTQHLDELNIVRTLLSLSSVGIEFYNKVRASILYFLPYSWVLLLRLQIAR